MSSKENLSELERKVLWALRGPEPLRSWSIRRWLTRDPVYMTVPRLRRLGFIRHVWFLKWELTSKGMGLNGGPYGFD